MSIPIVRRVLVATAVAVVAVLVTSLLAQAPKPAAPNLSDTDSAIKAAAELARREAAMPPP